VRPASNFGRSFSKIRDLPEFQHPPPSGHTRPPWYTSGLTIADTKRIERIARESADLARRSLKKSNEIEAYLSFMEYRAGKIRRHKSVGDLFGKTQVGIREIFTTGRFEKRPPSSTAILSATPRGEPRLEFGCGIPRMQVNLCEPD
jgi:hypothetical protein